MSKPIITIDKSQLFRIIKSNLNENTSKQTQEEGIDFEKLFNFSSIPEEELEEQYVDLSFTVSSSGYGGKFMGVNGRILKEDATSTLPTNETKRQMQTKFNLKDWQFATQTLANNVRLVVLYPGIFRNTRLIEKAMSACGWSLAKKGHIVKNRMVWKAMSFDRMFQKDVS